MTAVREPNPKQEFGSGGVLTLFSILWGAAAIFHVLGPSGRAFGVIRLPSPLGITQVLLCAAAVWLIVRPRQTAAFVVVAGLTFLTAWLEAPLLGNHWLLAVFVSLSLLLALVVTATEGSHRKAVAGAFLPQARICLLLFYCFAGFAKLNEGFLDPSVSCGTFFIDETLSSMGLGSFGVSGPGALAHLVPAATVLTELSIPVLLIFGKTRVAGVLLGLLFHSVVALDRTHLFIDFSSILAPLFVLFLPVQFSESALGFLRGRGRWLVGVWLALAMVVMGAQWIGGNIALGNIFIQGRMVLWYLTDASILVGVFAWLVRNRGAEPLRRPLSLPFQGRLVLALVPILVVVNGLFVYLELRTAFSYTMYSNLRMVDGESNHFIVRSSLPLGERHRDPVSVISTDDVGGLQSYVGSGFAIPWDSFRAYLSGNREIAVTYERGGERFEVARAGDEPALIAAPPLAIQKLLPMRAIDQNDPPRCQDVFLPAL